MEIRLQGVLCKIEKAKYTNGRLALFATVIEPGEDYGEPFATLTTNLVYEEIGENQAFLDVNNLPDIEADLKTAGIIDNPISVAQSGFVVYPLYNINFE